MAFQLSRRDRTTGIVGVLIAATLTVPTVAGATPHAAPPTIQSVQQRLHTLEMHNDQVVEQYDQANMAYQASKIAADEAATSYLAAAGRLSRAREQLTVTATAQYEGGSFSAAGALLSSDSGASYLDKLDTLSMLSSHNAQIVSSYAAMQKLATDAKKKAADLFAQATATRKKVAAQRTKTVEQIAKYTKLLASLNAAQRAWLAKLARAAADAQAKAVQAKAAQAKVNTAPAGATSMQANSTTGQASSNTVQRNTGSVNGGTGKVNTVRSSPAAVQTAVNFALAQVGKPYVFGAAGPGSYDCSGLTMSAYGAAGISLPHSAADQYNYGHHVDASSLQPGDLMFYYQPIGHVSMYIGNGMMVSAPQTGENVKVIPADTSNGYTGATRLVG